MTVIATIAFVATMIGLVGFLARRPQLAPRSESRGPSANAEALRNEMMRLALPTLYLTDAVEPSHSKLGGTPDLPVGMEWPTSVEGPMGFLVQIDLAAARASGGPDWLPVSGTLYAFHDERWGFADQVRVIYAPDGARAPVEPPFWLKKEWRYPERRVGFVQRQSIPSTDWLAVDPAAVDLRDVEWDDIDALRQPPEGQDRSHRLGGYPDEIQGDQMAVSSEYAIRGLECSYRDPVPPDILEASAAWRLLLQIDSDERLKMSWGDSGMIYVFVREQDARASDFSQTVAISQCF